MKDFKILIYLLIASIVGVFLVNKLVIYLSDL